MAKIPLLNIQVMMITLTLDFEICFHLKIGKIIVGNQT